MDKDQGLGGLAAREAVNRPDHYGGRDNSRDEWDAMAEVTRRPLPAERDEADALLAEVERLRAEVATMRAWAEKASAAENANAEDAKKERAAVVAFVRGARLDDFADAIERGEHRRKEDK